MDWFIARENIKRFRELLATETDPEKRRELQQLLKEAEEKLTALGAPPEQKRS